VVSIAGSTPASPADALRGRRDCPGTAFPCNRTVAMTLLKLDRVSRRFGPVTAVDEVSFSIGRGEVVGFLGPNGAGKSTTMRMINQYLDPDEGVISFDGVPLEHAREGAKRRIGYLPENNPLYPEMLVAEYLAFIARLRQLDAAEQRRSTDEAVQATAIASVYHRPIAELSKGYRQRVGLAAAILHRPDLLVLDEPTEGLDPNQRVEIRRLIGDLGRDRTVLLSTHVLPEVEQTCSRLLIISRGRLAADGPVAELIRRAHGATSVTLEAAGDGVAAAAGALPGVTEVAPLASRDGRTRVRLTVTGEDPRPALFRLAVARGWTLYELHQESGNLEDLFRELTASPPPGPARAEAAGAAA
jgi:ABC-2 type transport system ATP-binding protein